MLYMLGMCLHYDHIWASALLAYHYVKCEYYMNFRLYQSLFQVKAAVQ